MFSAIQSHIPTMEGYTHPSAIVVPFIKQEDGWYVLFTKRSATLKHQPNDICFPGGRIEKGEDAREAAIREAQEELGIQEAQIHIVGQSDIVITPFGACVYPFVAILDIESMDVCVYNPDEVQRLILVPLNYFLTQEPDLYQIGLKQEFPDDFPFDRIEKGRDYPFPPFKHKQYFYDYLGNTIWGLTARTMHNVVGLIKEGKDVCE